MELKELQEVREKIDAIDEKIAELFNERQSLALEIAKVKKENNLAIQDSAREEIVLKKAEERCGAYGRDLFRTIIKLSKKEQTK